MEAHVEQLVKLGNSVLDNRGALLNLFQTLAEHFYPERADFTTARNLGSEFGSDLMSSYPVLVRRDLGDALSSMLRPTNKDWYHQRVRPISSKISNDVRRSLGIEGRAWLENADHVMRRAMYHRPSNFARAAKEADHDFVTFGQAVLQISPNKLQNGLLFQTWHLRDCAWMENETGMVDTMFRKWEPSIAILERLFPGKLHQRVKERKEKDPFGLVNCWHAVVPSAIYGNDKFKRFPFVSVYIDCDNKHVMEEVGMRRFPYIVPRWRTVSGTQYAVSPATCAALPDARLLQAMVGVLLTAGEKAVDPPMVADKEVFGGSFSIWAGGLTWADMADGRIQDHFAQLPVDKNGIPLGLEMMQDTRHMLAEAFYLNKLNLPPPQANMTAYEVGQRVQEYIRQTMPLFEPLEYEYNAPMCELIFDILMNLGAFGSVHDIPDELRGKETEFVFESPLHDAIERQRGQQFSEMNAMLSEAVAIDPSSVYVIDIQAAFRDALEGAGLPAKWQRSETEAKYMADQVAQQQQAAEMLAQQQQAAEIAKTVGETQGTV